MCKTLRISKYFMVHKNLHALTTHKTWQNRTAFLYLTPSNPVSKQCIHSSVTTLSGLPRAARVAAWQCSTLYTVLSPSIHSFVSELRQERQGAWGRLRDESDKKRQNEKKTVSERDWESTEKCEKIWKDGDRKWDRGPKGTENKEWDGKQSGVSLKI